MEEFGSFKERKEGLAPYLSPLGPGRWLSAAR